jgi:glycosyltransferase involved in cell wall biosynthesis
MTRPSCLVVTPVRNAAGHLRQTAHSVLRQTAVSSGRADLEYIIVDGDSDDGTADVARCFDRARVISGPDAGMYDALRKGFSARRSEPTVCAYLNAGDLWHETALDLVLDVFEQREDVAWVTGYRSAITPEGYFISIAQPFAYSSDLILSGSYGRALPSIQQESTFWRGGLLAHVDMDRLADFRLAGDYYLWTTFARETHLYVLSALLGGFRMHGGHLSAARTAYDVERAEATGGRRASRHRELLHQVMWSLPDPLKKAFGGNGVLSYCRQTGRWAPPSDRLRVNPRQLLQRRNP